MKVIALQSGSNGNCIYVEAGGVQLLFDAGISGRQAQERLAQHGRDLADVDALVISHDHRDHTSCMGVYQRKFGFPVYVTERTLVASRINVAIGALRDVRHFTSGSSLCFKHVIVETIPTPHDAADGVAFVVDDGINRLGILTDLGHPFGRLTEVIHSLDAVVIESNYDCAMLARGPYPEALKQRIRGPQGHLSNDESARLLYAAASSRMKWACLAHLSEENNVPKLALEAHRNVLGTRLPLRLASRYGATDVMEI